MTTDYQLSITSRFRLNNAELRISLSFHFISRKNLVGLAHHMSWFLWDLCLLQSNQLLTENSCSILEDRSVNGKEAIGRNS